MSGAGFMTQGGSQNDGQSGESYERSSRHFIMKQLAEMPKEEPFTIDGAPVKNVLLVGYITDVSPKGSRTVITATDGTHECSMTLFSNGSDAPPEIASNQYALFYVYPRLYAETLQLTASNVVQGIPFSQVLHHELAALREHLHFTGAKPFEGVASRPKSEAKESQGLSQHNAFDSFGDEIEQKRIIMDNWNTDEPISIDALVRTYNCERDHMEKLIKDLSDDGQIWDDGYGGLQKMET